MKLKNKNILITGASRGIGMAIALLFAKEGANIAIHCRRHDKEEDDLVKEIQKKYGCKVACFEADLTNLSEIKKMVSQTKKVFGSIDILVNNAGYYPETPFLDETQKDWDKVINTNLRSAYFCSQYVAKIMLKQNSGNIINMVSVAGVYPRKNKFLYAVSKAGLIHFSKSLALTLAPHIRVNAIAPSYTWTKLMTFMNDPKIVKKKKKIIPLGKFNQPEDVANAALFFACEDSKKITGQVLVIDGGRGGNIL